MYRSTFNADEKSWSGIVQPSLYNPNISLGHVLLRAMKTNSNKTAQISANNNMRLTYEELHTKSVRAAQNIQKLKHQKGDVFAIISRNNHDLSPIVMALLSTGHPFNALDPTFTETEMTHMLNITKPKLIFTEVESYETVKQSLRQLNNDAKIYTFGGQIQNSLTVESLFVETNVESEFIPVDVDGENDTAVIVCSSGTTGLAKGVCVPHAALLDHLTRDFDISTNSVLVCFSSLYWASGVMMLLLGILSSATRIITTEAYSPELLLHLIEQYKVTLIWNSSFQMVLCAKDISLQHRDLSSVKVWLATGSKAPLDACVHINKFLPNGAVIAGYGLSEMIGFIAMNLPYKETEAVGQLASGMRMKIVDEAGERLGIGQSGEICLKGVYKFGGYYGNVESTDALFDAEKFVRTGDIGFVDEGGLLYITDRKKDFFRYRHFTISPTEIENQLIACPKIAAVCVVGIPDILPGDLPAAVIVRNADSNITEQEVQEIVANKLADCKKLRGGVYFVDSLPTTPSGKVLRREVKKLAVNLYKIYAEKNGNSSEA